jgi:hypothetical protein
MILGPRWGLTPKQTSRMIVGLKTYNLLFDWLRVTVVRREKLVSEVLREFWNIEKGDSPPLETSTKQRLQNIERTSSVQLLQRFLKSIIIQ